MLQFVKNLLISLVKKISIQTWKKIGIGYGSLGLAFSLFESPKWIERCKGNSQYGALLFFLYLIFFPVILISKLFGLKKQKVSEPEKEVD